VIKPQIQKLAARSKVIQGIALDSSSLMKKMPSFMQAKPVISQDKVESSLFNQPSTEVMSTINDPMANALALFPFRNPYTGMVEANYYPTDDFGANGKIEIQEQIENLEKVTSESGFEGNPMKSQKVLSEETSKSINEFLDNLDSEIDNPIEARFEGSEGSPSILILGSYSTKNYHILDKLQQALVENSYINARLISQFDEMDSIRRICSRLGKNPAERNQMFYEFVEERMGQTDIRVFVIFSSIATKTTYEDESTIVELITHLESDQYKKNPENTLLLVPDNYKSNIIEGIAEDSNLNVIRFSKTEEINSKVIGFIESNIRSDEVIEIPVFRRPSDMTLFKYKAIRQTFNELRIENIEFLNEIMKKTNKEILQTAENKIKQPGFNLFILFKSESGENDATVALLSSYLKSNEFNEDNNLLIIPEGHYTSILEGLSTQQSLNIEQYSDDFEISKLLSNFFKDKNKREIAVDGIRIIGSYIPFHIDHWYNPSIEDYVFFYDHFS